MNARKKTTPPPEILALWKQWIDVNTRDNTNRFLAQLRKLPVDQIESHVLWLIQYPKYADISSFGREPEASQRVRATALEWAFHGKMLSLTQQLLFLKTHWTGALGELALREFLSAKSLHKALNYHERTLVLQTLEEIKTPAVIQLVLYYGCDNLAYEESPLWYLVQHFSTPENQACWEEVLRIASFEPVFLAIPKYFDYLVQIYPSMRDLLVRSLLSRTGYSIRNVVDGHPEMPALRAHLTQLLLEDVATEKPLVLNKKLDAHDIYCWVGTLGDNLHPRIETFLRQQAWDVVRNEG